MTDAVSTPAATAAAAAGAAAQPELAKLKSVAQQFEAVFLRQMIGAMRQAKLDDGMLDTSASDQFRDMGDAKLAEQMAGHGALHIADLLVKQFGARLGGAPAAPGTAPAPAAKDGTAR